MLVTGVSQNSVRGPAAGLDAQDGINSTARRLPSKSDCRIRGWLRGFWNKIATLGLVRIVFGPVMNVIACQLVA